MKWHQIQNILACIGKFSLSSVSGVVLLKISENDRFYEIGDPKAFREAGGVNAIRGFPT
jgi:hypothetical protein